MEDEDQKDEAYIDSSASPMKLMALNIAGCRSTNKIATEFNIRITTWKPVITEEISTARAAYNDNKVSVEIIVGEK